jgi:hypothetical protein
MEFSDIVFILLIAFGTAGFMVWTDLKIKNLTRRIIALESRAASEPADPDRR